MLTAAARELLELASRGQISAMKHRTCGTGAGGSAVYSEPAWLDFTRTDRRTRNGVSARVLKLIENGAAEVMQTEDLGHGEARGTVVLTDAGRALLGIAERDSARWPQYSTCKHCKSVIRRDGHGASWVASGPAGTTHTQCPKAPNPNDETMPGHAPGTAIVSPPAVEPEPTSDPSALPSPIIPWIPKTQA